MTNLLPILLLVPLIGAVVCALLPNDRMAKAWAFSVSIITLAIGCVLAGQYYTASEAVQSTTAFVFGPVAGQRWSLGISSIGFNFSLGMNSISLWLVLLTVFLTPLAIAASFGSIRTREKEYYAWMLGLLTAELGVFIAQDLLLFYTFFELTLIPMFFIIGIWGGPERRWAAGKFFLFTFAGSIFTLAAAIYLGAQARSFDISRIIDYAQTDALSQTARFWCVLGLIAGFAVKVPLFPVHTWLPLAHTEAPTAGSVILAGVLLKLGTYGLLKLAVPIGLVSRAHNIDVLIKVMGALCVVGVIYGALAAWVQRDIKKLVAYSSVSHLGFCVLGLLALNDYGLQGSVLYMVNHGLSTGALFLVIGMIYDRYHTRDIDQINGLARIMPKMAFFFVLFAFSSIGLPGLNGFWSEFLTVLGAFTSDRLGIAFGAFAALGVILGAVYMLHMVGRVIWGPLRVPEQTTEGHDAHAVQDTHATSHATPNKSYNDLTGRELGILTPLAIAIVLLGIFPNAMTQYIKTPLREIQNPRPMAHIDVVPPPITAPMTPPATLAANTKETNRP